MVKTLKPLTSEPRHVGVVDLLTMSISGAKAYQVITQFLRHADTLMDPVIGFIARL